jgi:hypothetical protein
MKQYYVLMSNSRQELISMVEQHLREGWKLQGGISASQGPMAFSSTLFAQAVIKEATDDRDS